MSTTPVRSWVVSTSTGDLAALALEQVRANGVRITTPRRVIIEALAAAGRSHLTAAELATLVQRDHPEINASTVYRCLELLGELGVASHSHVPGGAAVYHLDEERHQHLVCDTCGRVIDVPLEPFVDLAAGIRSTYGFELRLGHDALSGRCRACRAGDPPA